MKESPTPSLHCLAAARQPMILSRLEETSRKHLPALNSDICQLSSSSYLASISGNLFMAVSAVYPYKCADILPVEISRNCIITGWALKLEQNYGNR
jgi:hypothetical protein